MVPVASPPGSGVNFRSTDTRLAGLATFVAVTTTVASRFEPVMLIWTLLLRPRYSPSVGFVTVIVAA